MKELQTKIGVGHSINRNVNYLKVSKPNYLRAAKYLKDHGFHRLLTVSAVDWIEQEKFEVYFIAHKLRGNLYVKVTTIIPRDNPVIPSLSELWPNAAVHERETWELFGISFEGNKFLKPLFLEDHFEIPPFRKDFDWREYVRKAYFEKTK